MFIVSHVQDFATSSLYGEVVREEASEPGSGRKPLDLTVGGEEHLEQYQIVERRRWEQR